MINFFYKTIRKNIGIILFFLLFAVIIVQLRSCVGLSHLFHLIFPPKDLFEHVVQEPFRLDQKGFSKTFDFKPKYSDTYQIGFLNRNGSIPELKFRGRIEAQFFYKNQLVLKKTSSSMAFAIGEGKDFSLYKDIALMTFPVPVAKKYSKDLKIKVTVIEADEQFSKFGDALDIFFRVAPVP